MAPRTDTRERTLRTAANLFRAQGYHGTGLNQVLAEGGLPKGSLYFHFPGGKEQLAAEAVALAGTELCAMVRALLDAAPDVASGIDAVVGALAADLEQSDYTNGCPIATVAYDTTDNDLIRTACASAFQSWQEVLEQFCAKHGVPVELASTALAAVEGGLLLARNQRDTAPLRRVGEHLKLFLERS